MLSHLKSNKQASMNKEHGRYEMKATIQAVLLCTCITSMNALAEGDDLNLEPCMNGGVSVSGLFPTQKAEDRFHEMQLESKQNELEPCINSNVSASGNYIDQETEDRHQRAQGEV